MHTTTLCPPKTTFTRWTTHQHQQKALHYPWHGSVLPPVGHHMAGDVRELLGLARTETALGKGHVGCPSDRIVLDTSIYVIVLAVLAKAAFEPQIVRAADEVAFPSAPSDGVPTR